MIDKRFTKTKTVNSGQYKSGQKGTQSKKVLKFDLDGKFIREFESAKDAGSEIGVTGGGIQYTCTKSKSGISKGFKYSYKPDIKIVILGHGRMGKDTVAEMINKYTGMSFKSSSLAAAEIFLYDDLKEEYCYKSFEECFNDRHTQYNMSGGYNMREVWHNKISEYNTPDKAKLASDILKQNDIYVGMRSDEEIQACIKKGLFDMIIGVFDPRKALEPKESFNIDMWAVCDFIIMNNSSLEVLDDRVKVFCRAIS